MVRSSPERRTPAACASLPTCLLITADDMHSPSSCWPAHSVSWLAALFASPRLAHVRPIAQLPREASSAPPTAHGKVIRRRQSLKLRPACPFQRARSLLAGVFSCSQVAAHAPERPLRARPGAGMSSAWGRRVRRPLRRRRRQQGGARRVCERAHACAVEWAEGTMRAHGVGLPGRPRSGSWRPGSAQAVVPGCPGVIGSAVVGDAATVLSSAGSAHGPRKKSAVPSVRVRVHLRVRA